MARKYPLYVIISIISAEKFGHLGSNMQMIISDRNSATLFHSLKFAREGDILRFPLRTLGFAEYKLKILEDFHLEDDPNYSCRNYQQAGEYDSCLETEYTRQSLDLLNCTPPWMTDRTDLWCSGQQKLTEEKLEKTLFLLGIIDLFSGQNNEAVQFNRSHIAWNWRLGKLLSSL